MKRRFLAMILIAVLVLSGCVPETEIPPVTTAAMSTTAAAEISTITETYVTTAETIKAVMTTTSEAETEIEIVIIPEDTEDNNRIFKLDLLEDYDTRTDLLFTALTANDIPTLSHLGSTRSDGVYDFIRDIEFGGFTINSGATADNPGMSHPPKTYNVSLTVLESADPRFPVGENTYEITALDAGIGPFFGPLLLAGNNENKTKITDMINTETLSENASICYYFTLEMMPFYGRDSVDGFSIPEDDIDGFYSGLARFFGHIPTIAQSETADNYNAAAKQILGIDTAFNEQNINPLWYGANMLDAVLVSETDGGIVIDYYADSMLLVKAFTVEYQFETENGFRFTAVKNLYDSGFNPSRYTT